MECGQGGLCKGGAGTIQVASKKIPAVHVHAMICPDKQTKCGFHETCCPIGGGLYACCPTSEVGSCVPGMVMGYNAETVIFILFFFYY